MSTEAAEHADFSRIRYAQVWEDADVLLEALDIQPGDTCLSIASAGDNALAMLTRDPARVIAIDLNPAQLACVRLRIAAYRTLEHKELLELIGSRPSDQRAKLYERCQSELDDQTRRFWDAQPERIALGIGGAGKFEDYFRIFREKVLPWVHSRRRIDELLTSCDPESRIAFYDQRWNKLRWRLMFRVFFSRWVMGRLGRDPAFFRYVDGSVAERIFSRAEHALTALDPSANPYLTWILTGTHPDALPLALRPEVFDVIRQRLDRVELRCATIEDTLDSISPGSIARYNLSDIFEYMSIENTEAILKRCVARGQMAGRLVYWNMLVPRSRPESMAGCLGSRDDIAEPLFLKDKAFFYRRLVVEEIL